MNTFFGSAHVYEQIWLPPRFYTFTHSILLAKNIYTKVIVSDYIYFKNIYIVKLIVKKDFRL